MVGAFTAEKVCRSCHSSFLMLLEQQLSTLHVVSFLFLQSRLEDVLGDVGGVAS